MMYALTIKPYRMKILKTCLILAIFFSLLSCVSKKKFEALENKVDKLTQSTALDFSDDDQDGVINALDQQPNTREGCPVDTRGVTLDSDNDGFVDCEDREPFSPPGYAVDSRGVAEIEISVGSPAPMASPPTAPPPPPVIEEVPEEEIEEEEEPVFVDQTVEEETVVEAPPPPAPPPPPPAANCCI